EDLPGTVPNFATIDVSFISLKLILPPLLELVDQPAGIVALIKPQFEAGREKVGKNGIIRDPQVHLEVLEEILTFADDLGLQLHGLTFSPITGGEGNIEFLAYWRVGAEQDGQAGELITDIRSAAEQAVQAAVATFSST